MKKLLALLAFAASFALLSAVPASAQSCADLLSKAKEDVYKMKTGTLTGEVQSLINQAEAEEKAGNPSACVSTMGRAIEIIEKYR